MASLSAKSRSISTPRSARPHGPDAYACFFFANVSWDQPRSLRAFFRADTLIAIAAHPFRHGLFARGIVGHVLSCVLLTILHRRATVVTVVTVALSGVLTVYSSLATKGHNAPGTLVMKVLAR